MGADNWAVCPRCIGRARAAEAEQLAAVMADYGKIPVTEFDKARAVVTTPRDQDFDTFREDYSITGAATGTVTVGYHGQCTECGLILSFTCEHPIEGAP